MTKYIIVTGGVISGLGKGVTAASIGPILKELGETRITIKKLDPYLNVDPGTLNPLEHGEVFVTRDGTEADLDLGYYERLAGIITSHKNSVSSGKLYLNLLNKERNGEYLGKTVQVIPHLTNEIKDFIRADANEYDYIICEIGGSIGDIEAMAFYETLRQLKYTDDVMFVHVTYIVHYTVSNELKTKPTQNALKELMQTGICPDVLICRTEQPMHQSVLDKLALYSNLPIESIIAAPNISSIYKLPYLYIQQNLHTLISNRFQIQTKLAAEHRWKYVSDTIDALYNTVTIGIVGKYVDLPDSYCSILEATFHAGVSLQKKVNIQWINARTLSKSELQDALGSVDAVIIPGGFGTNGIDMIIHAISFIREKGIPFLGICMGMQLSVIEYAKNVLHISNAHSTEFCDTTDPIVIKMDDFTKDGNLGGTMRLGSCDVIVRTNTLAHTIYGKKLISERHRHRYDVNTTYCEKLEASGLIISGKSPSDLVEIVELPKDKHPFFIATQYHPEYESFMFKPHPLFVGLMQHIIPQESLPLGN